MIFKKQKKEVSHVELKWIAAAQKGDREAYRQLVEQYQVRAFNYANSILRNPVDAEDVVQDAFVKAYFALKNFEGNSSFYSWLYRIIHNLCIDIKRKQRRNQKYEDINANVLDSFTEDSNNFAYNSKVIPIHTITAEDEIIQKENIALINKAINSLSTEQQEIIRMRELEGFSYEEIASILEINSGTVMSRLFYARKKLQEYLLHDEKKQNLVLNKMKEVKEKIQHKVQNTKIILKTVNCIFVCLKA